MPECILEVGRHVRHYVRMTHTAAVFVCLCVVERPDVISARALISEGPCNIFPEARAECRGVCRSNVQVREVDGDEVAHCRRRSVAKRTPWKAFVAARMPMKAVDFVLIRRT